MKLKVDIDTKTFIRFFAVASSFYIAASLIGRLAQPLTLIFISFFLAIALTPPVNKLSSLLPRHSRVGAAALSYVIVIAVLGGFLIIAVPPVVSQTVTFAREVPSYVENLQQPSGPLRDFLRQNNLQQQYDSSVSDIQSQLAGIAGSVGGAFVTSVGALLSGFISLLTVLVLTFLMIIEGPQWIRRIWALYLDDAQRERHEELAGKMFRIVTGYVNGQVVVAAIAAACALAVLLLLSGLFNVPITAVLPLAGIILITSMIPMIGATIGAAVVSLVLLFNDVTAALIFLAYYIVYQQVENNLVQPAIQSRSVDLSALAVILAVVIGASLAGILGALVSIPIAACIRILVKDFIVHRRREAAKQPENVIHKVKKALRGEA